MTDTADATGSPRPAADTEKSFAWLFTWRNLLGAALLLVMVGVLGIYVYEQSRDVPIDCSEAERLGVNESGRMLVTHLDSDIKELTLQINAATQAKSGKERELETTMAQLSGGIRQLTVKTSQLDTKTDELAGIIAEATESGEADAPGGDAPGSDTPSVSTTTTTTTTTTVPSGPTAPEGQPAGSTTTTTTTTEAPDDAVRTLEEETSTLQNEIAALQANIEMLEASVEVVHAEIESLDQTLDLLRAERDDKQEARKRADAAQLATTGPDFDTVPYSPPRTSINLQPREPVAEIALGSVRSPKRAEIVMEQVSANDVDGADSGDAESSQPAAVSQLPTKPTFVVSTGQFQRADDVEIKTEHIHVWARWVDQVMLLDICIDADTRLDPGRYTGEVYLVDPAVSPARVSVEVTAQSRWINLSYLLLIISPFAAFGYVWVISRHSAGVTPWDRAAFRRWAAQNLVLCFAVGFAAVWATLQVPFNNPTWGTSVIAAASVIGVGLVAAVTAMTAVAGRVRDD